MDPSSDKRKDFHLLLKKYKPKTLKHYIIEYLLKNIDKKLYTQECILHYINERCKQDEKKPYSNADRNVKSFFNQDYNHMFEIVKTRNPKLLKYLPPYERIKKKQKNNDFTNKQKITKIEECKGLCELTGIKLTKKTGNADHFWPKDKGGECEYKNCVWMHKDLNNQKRNRDPVDWFCKVFITNFLNICKRSGFNLKSVKERMIKFIDDF